MGHRCLTVARARSTFIFREPKMGHAEYASKSLAVLMKLAAMLRIVPAMQFVVDKLAALLRGKGSDELLADEFLDEASCITKSAVVQHAGVLRPASDIAVPTTNEMPDREKLIRRRWLETGIKMWNPDHHGAGHAALNIQGRAELLPPTKGLTGKPTSRGKVILRRSSGTMARRATWRNGTKQTRTDEPG